MPKLDTMMFDIALSTHRQVRFSTKAQLIQDSPSGQRNNEFEWAMRPSALKVTLSSQAVPGSSYGTAETPAQ
jgi:hypothetical protein